MGKIIDRQNKNDLIKQICIVENNIKKLDKKRSKFDKEIKSLPNRLIYLNEQKLNNSLKISKKQMYLNQLENDISKL